MIPYGYTYKTTVSTANGEKEYFGQKKSSKFIPTYFGSGSKIKDWLAKHRDDIDFAAKIKVDLLDWAYTYEDLNKLEFLCVEPHLNKDYCWNLVSGGNMPCVTDEFRRKISENNKSGTEEVRRKISENSKSGTDEVRHKISVALKGKSCHTEESKKKIGEAARNCSAETRRKVSEKHKGKKISEETKAKLSKANAGKQLSEETRRRIAEKNKGKKHTDETKRKIGETSKGRVHSEKTRELIRAANKGSKNKVGYTTTEKTKKLISENNGVNVKVMCVESGELFYNISECSRETGLTRKYLNEILYSRTMANPRILTRYSEAKRAVLTKYTGCYFSPIMEG